MTEEQWIAQAKQGDHGAYRKLVERYQHYVYSLIRGMVKDRQTAEDLAQETFIQVYRSLSRFDGRAQFSTWLYQVARNKVIDWFRSKAKKEKDLETTLTDVYETGHSLEEEIVNRDVSFRIRQLMEELPEHYRVVLSLFYERDMTMKEIATYLKVPYQTVQTRLRRGKEQLFHKWQEVNRRDM